MGVAVSLLRTGRRVGSGVADGFGSVVAVGASVAVGTRVAVGAIVAVGTGVLVGRGVDVDFFFFSLVGFGDNVEVGVTVAV